MSEQRFAIFSFVSFICLCYLLFSFCFIRNGNEQFAQFALGCAMGAFVISALILGGKEAVILVRKKLN